MHRLITVGKIKNPALAEFAEELQKRMTRFFKLEIKELKESHLEKESLQILPWMKGYYNVALQIEGKMLDSLAFSDFLFKSQRDMPLCFILGGPDGLSLKVIESCVFQLSLSPMTFPHDLARLLLLEQIYRAGTIFQGHPYHLKH
ncbi:MAG: 23S rRNA (pseudouridine(1915)-N(3))-methyltransferase RlmH [Planctomycetota bacterium]